jgi:preprotein translocase subunit YajC
MSSHISQLALTFHGLLATTSKTKSSGSSATLFILIGFAILLYFLVFRGRNAKRRQAQQQAQAVNIGDEVMLTSGIIGRVTEIDGDRASIEIAPDIEIEVIRRAIAQRMVSADAPADTFVAPTDSENGAYNDADSEYDANDYGDSPDYDEVGDSSDTDGSHEQLDSADSPEENH